jgi:hypothetical protein
LAETEDARLLLAEALEAQLKAKKCFRNPLGVEEEG